MEAIATEENNIMKKQLLAFFAVTLVPAVLYAVDGQILINQATVNAAGGFPYTISNPGSYKLAGNLIPGSGHNGIEIAADHVTIDLSGFAIIGPGLNGISTKSPRPDGSFLYYDITIRNGAISGMSGVGIGMIADEVLIEYMKILSNGGGGLAVNGVGLFVHQGNLVAPGIAQVVDHCVISNNARFGMAIDGGRVSYNVVTRNGVGNSNVNGMNFENGGQILYNIVSENGGRGIRFDGDYGNSPVGFLIGNVIRGNGEIPIGGGGSYVNLGQNLCGNVVCPAAQF
jgi:hypothetical protein